MIIKDKIGLSYDDLDIVPAVISDIDHRKECNVYDENGMLPIFSAPMMTVINEFNYKIYKDNKINVIIPRTVKYDQRIEFLNNGEWVAFSLTEFEKLFCRFNDNDGAAFGVKGNTYKVCIDMANGHMHSLYKITFIAKRLAKNFGYNIIIMVGNIAYSETYRWICLNTKVDYVRLSVGSGANCFIDGTKITMANGEKKNIEDINLGESVKTLNNEIHKVISNIRYKENKVLTINNEITCTENHKFYVINKKDKDLVNENNLIKYGYWVEANKLNKDIHLLIKSEQV